MCNFNNLIYQSSEKNIENLKQQGFDYIEFTSNPKVRKNFNRIGLEMIGDISLARTHIN